MLRLQSSLGRLRNRLNIPFLSAQGQPSPQQHTARANHMILRQAQDDYVGDRLQGTGNRAHSQQQTQDPSTPVSNAEESALDPPPLRMTRVLGDRKRGA